MLPNISVIVGIEKNIDFISYGSEIMVLKEHKIVKNSNKTMKNYNKRRILQRDIV